MNYSPDRLEGHGFGRVEELSQGVVWCVEANQYMINRRTATQEGRPGWAGGGGKKGRTGFWKDSDLDADCLAHLDIKTSWR